MLTWSRLKVALKASMCREMWSLSIRQRWALTKVLFATRPATAETGTMFCVYCPPVESAAFRRHLTGLKRIGMGQHVPLVVHISLTDRCPCSCRRCSNLRSGRSDPSLSRVVDLLSRLRQAGTVTVAFTGGEPLLREDLPEIVAACGREMCSVLFTTGYGLTEERVRSLRTAGLTAAFVSLDHYDPAEHNRIRGQPDAFDMAIRAVRLFRPSGAYTAIQAVVSRDLLDDEPMNRFLRFCRNLDVHEVMLLEPIAVGGRTTTCTMLPDEDRQRLASIHRRSLANRSAPKVNTMPFLEGPDFFGCQAGFCFLYVSTSGEVLPCDFVPFSLGNAFETDLPVLLDRSSKCFARPSRSCLAREAAGLIGRVVDAPTGWEQSERAMGRRRFIALPELMKLMLR